MSALSRSYSWLVCDGCAAVYPRPGTPIAALREHAATEGWKHERVQYERSNWLRAVDLCPKCEEVAPCVA